MKNARLEELAALLDYLKSRVPKHTLESQWGVSADVILSAISRSSDLTKRGVRGIIAEAIFERKILAPLVRQGWEVAVLIDDQPYDFLIRKDDRQVRIQVKLQRMEKGVPKVASKRRYPSEDDMYVVEVQKTRGGIDLQTNEQTRPYRFGDFDILAVNMHPSTADWTKFLFTVGNWLLPRVKNEALIEIMQPVPKGPNNEVWTNKLETCITWLEGNEKKRILKVEPGRSKRRERKPKRS